MAPIDVKCWDCGKSIQVHEKFAGKKGKCPVCGKVIEIPDPGKAAESHFDVNIDVDDEAVRRAAQTLASGPGVTRKKKRGLFARMFGKK